MKAGIWMRAAILAIALFCMASGADAVERRRDQFGKEFGYFIYPIASEIPGLGTASGFGATVLNMFETDADFTGFHLEGDFDASGYAFLDLHLIPRRLIFDTGLFDFRVAPVIYNRGIDSSREEFFLPYVEGDIAIGQLTLTFDERLFEVFYRIAEGKRRVLSVFDGSGNEFENFDDSTRKVRQTTIGGVLDITDDRLDPRKGLRLEIARRIPETEDPFLSEFNITDTNLTAYIPFRKWDTLAINYFQSDARVTRKATTDIDELRAAIGLECGSLSGQAFQQCIDTQNDRIADRIALNENGNASSLGGTQRLRAFPNGRFVAGHTLFYGLEYRWNLNDFREPFNFLIMKGVHTGIQIAFFAESGSVADDRSKLKENMKTSYGAGLRLLFTGVIVRADWATGEEGDQFQLFINYPWSMFSVDSPG